MSALVQILDDDLRAELLALEVEGRLTPEAVIKAAENPDSPLHDHFEWDDTVAARNWRIVQARVLIRKVRIVVAHQSEVRTIPAYVHPPGQAAGYVRALTLRSSTDAARTQLLDELSRVASALSRAEAYAALFGLLPDVVEMRQSVERLMQQVHVEPGVAAE